MIVRRGVAAILFATVGAACSNAAREKVAADSMAALTATIDSMRLAAAADSVRRDSIAAALARKAGATGAKARRGGTSTKIIGRDSVRLGPIRRLPVDTPRKPE